MRIWTRTKPKPKIRYHYAITIVSPRPGGGIRMGTYSNSVEWSGTRFQAFVYFRNHASIMLETKLDETYVVSWSFEPDDLP